MLVVVVFCTLFNILGPDFVCVGFDLVNLGEDNVYCGCVHLY